MALLRALSLSALLVFTLSGCDQINDVLNKQKSIGKAIGAACRQSGRSLEDCYNRNPKVSKPDIFAGWKEMSEYMQAKKLDIIPPPLDQPEEGVGDEKPLASKASEAPGEHATAPASAASAAKPAEKHATKAPAKH